MGCWNKTCGLSNLHIKAGERAYVFVLEKDSDDSHCYTTHLYRPLLLPFETTYNDYGGGEKSSGPGFQLIMDAIKKHLHEMELGENKYHDIAVTKEAFGEELFFDAVHEGRLFRKGNFSDPVKLEYVMFRKDVVDHILDNDVIEQYVGDGKGTCGWGNNYIRYRFADVLADVRPLLELVIKELEEASEHVRDYLLYGGLEGAIHKHYQTNKAARYLRGDSYRYSRLVHMNDVVCEFLKNNDLDGLETILKEWMKGIYIDGFMHLTRKSWIPAGHEGSQCQEHKPYRLLISATTAVLDREKAEWEEENEGVFEE